MLFEEEREVEPKIKRMCILHFATLDITTITMKYTTNALIHIFVKQVAQIALLRMQRDAI